MAKMYEPSVQFTYQPNPSLRRLIKVEAKKERDLIASELRKAHRENPRLARLLCRRLREARVAALEQIASRVFNEGFL